MNDILLLPSTTFPLVDGNYQVINREGYLSVCLFENRKWYSQPNKNYMETHNFFWLDMKYEQNINCNKNQHIKSEEFDCDCCIFGEFCRKLEWCRDSENFNVSDMLEELIKQAKTLCSKNHSKYIISELSTVNRQLGDS